MKKSATNLKTTNNIKKTSTSKLAKKPNISIVNIEPKYDIYVIAYIKQKSYNIYCADGSQKFRWLMNVALHFFEKGFALTAGKKSR